MQIHIRGKDKRFSISQLTNPFALREFLGQHINAILQKHNISRFREEQVAFYGNWTFGLFIS